MTTGVARRTTIYITILFLFLGGCSTGQDRAIEKILNQCAQNTKKVNNSKMSAAQAAQFLASEMQSMDTRDCPPEFRVAFQKHINAWRDASNSLAQNTSVNAFLEILAAGYFQDSSLLGVAQQNASIAASRINASYEQLVSIAAAHGARVPESIVQVTK